MNENCQEAGPQKLMCLYCIFLALMPDVTERRGRGHELEERTMLDMLGLVK